MDQYRTLIADTYSAYFAEWEKQALIPKDLLQRTPAEVHDRQRAAHVIRRLRAKQEPAYDVAAVFAELQKLVLSQTKALNTCQVYEVKEVEALEEAIARIGTGPDAWSRLIKLLGQVRTTTMKRYHEAQVQPAYSYLLCTSPKNA